MKLASESFADGSPIPPEFAFCKIDAVTHAALSANRNPQLSWRDAWAGAGGSGGHRLVHAESGGKTLGNP